MPGENPLREPQRYCRCWVCCETRYRRSRWVREQYGGESSEVDRIEQSGVVDGSGIAELFE
jgi:hypothetical protein